MFFGVFLREKQTGPTFVGAGIPKQCVVGSATTLKKTAGFRPLFAIINLFYNVAKYFVAEIAAAAPIPADVTTCLKYGSAISPAA